MSLKFTAGDLTIHRLIEEETTFLPVHDLFAGLTPDLLAENRRWLRDSGAIDATDTLILCFQSYVVRTPHHTILIDSCIGNDKPRPQRPKWNQRTDDTYMRALKAAGFSVEDIDFVMCTHLHVDHVGWNTRLEGGRWGGAEPWAPGGACCVAAVARAGCRELRMRLVPEPGACDSAFAELRERVGSLVDRRIVLRAIDRERNVQRSWVCSVGRDLFGDLVVSVTFGRTGTDGRTIRYAMVDEGSAERFLLKALRRRAGAERRCGAAYRVVDATGFGALPHGLIAGRL